MNARERQPVDDLLRLASLNDRSPEQLRELLLAAVAEIERQAVEDSPEARPRYAPRPSLPGH